MEQSGREISISISVEEWQDILGWMHQSLTRSESDPTGHFLLEIRGQHRTWVTTDGAQLTALEVDGPAPRCNFENNVGVSILVNSRFFRAKSPEDVTLTVFEQGDGRLQSLQGEGFEMILPEHPGPFPEWRGLVENLEGIQVEVDSNRLIDACGAVAVVPMGIENESPVSAWIYVEDGRLVLEAPWLRYPDSKVFIDLEESAPDTVHVLVSPVRLRELLVATDSAQIALTIPASPLGVIGLAHGNYRALLKPLDRWGSQKEQLEKLLCEFLRAEEVTPDQDGDYLITTPEGNRLWVRLHVGIETISVQVFSVLASPVPCTSELLMELNSINATAPFVKVIWADDAIMAETDIVAEQLDISELSNAILVVQATADRYLGVLSAFFGSSEDAEEGP